MRLKKANLSMMYWAWEIFMKYKYRVQYWNNIFFNDNKDEFEYGSNCGKGNKHEYGVYKWADGSKFQGQREELDPSC